MHAPAAGGHGRSSVQRLRTAGVFGGEDVGGALRGRERSNRRSGMMSTDSHRGGEGEQGCRTRPASQGGVGGRGSGETETGRGVAGRGDDASNGEAVDCCRAQGPVARSSMVSSRQQAVPEPPGLGSVGCMESAGRAKEARCKEARDLRADGSGGAVKRKGRARARDRQGGAGQPPTSLDPGGGGGGGGGSGCRIDHGIQDRLQRPPPALGGKGKVEASAGHSRPSTLPPLLTLQDQRVESGGRRVRGERWLGEVVGVLSPLSGERGWKGRDRRVALGGVHRNLGIEQDALTGQWFVGQLHTCGAVARAQQVAKLSPMPHSARLASSRNTGELVPYETAKGWQTERARRNARCDYYLQEPRHARSPQQKGTGEFGFHHGAASQ